MEEVCCCCHEIIVDTPHECICECCDRVYCDTCWDICDTDLECSKYNDD